MPTDAPANRPPTHRRTDAPTHWSLVPWALGTRRGERSHALRWLMCGVALALSVGLDLDAIMLQLHCTPVQSFKTRQISAGRHRDPLRDAWLTLIHFNQSFQLPHEGQFRSLGILETPHHHFEYLLPQVTFPIPRRF